MCMYSSRDGFVTPWHLVHLGSFAIHGAGTVMVEATAVEARGRISPQDLGLWKEEQIAGHTSLVRTLKQLSPGVTVGLQLAHAGRKASTWAPTFAGPKPHAPVTPYVPRAQGGWDDDLVSCSNLAYAPGWVTPKAVTLDQLEHVKQSFVRSAQRAFEAGYDLVEIHGAHG